MKKRLTKIITKTGDKGATRMANGSTVAKSDLLIQVIGEIDELNSYIGLVLAHHDQLDDLFHLLKRIQNELFDLGVEVTLLGKKVLDEQYITRLEQDAETLNANLPELQEFILPGGTLCASHCHVARAICRRLERRFVELTNDQPSLKPSLPYINRLSDLLFIVARTFNHRAHHEEPYWHKNPDG
jgi:cob(I)alamin adenosyltransferase